MTDDDQNPQGHIGDPCPDCGIPVFTPGPELAGSGVLVVRCCCTDKGVHKA